jgi:hemerythrin-like domain-containing protein
MRSTHCQSAMRLSFGMKPDRNLQGRQRDERLLNRRVFLKNGIIFSGAALAGVGLRGAETAKKSDEKEAEVGPPEDLMREHGVLKRVLLIYGEALRRLDAKQDFPPEALADAAGIIRSFVEDYHEKLEEDFLFPRFEKANQLVDLVKVLRTQHEAGRSVTDVTMRFANLQSLRSESERTQLVNSMQQFIRMYNPHEAREDTVLFPAFRKIVSPHEFDSLGEDFEKKEDELFGEDGFEKMVDKVAGIEKRFGIYDLAQFTPKI